MTAFTITRLHTDQGIFKASGQWDNENKSVQVTELAMMGTDGWVNLNLEQPPVIDLVANLRDDFIQHLS